MDISNYIDTKYRSKFSCFYIIFVYYLRDELTWRINQTD